MNSSKILVIFDFDRTLIDKDSESAITHLLPSSIYKPIQKARGQNWIDHMNKIYGAMREYGIKMKDIIYTLENLQMNKGMRELLEYLYSNKSIYEIVLFSSSSTFLVETVLNHYNIKSYFSEIVTVYSKVDSMSNFLVNYKTTKFNCPFCDLCLCKSQCYYDFINKKKDKFRNVLHICDGHNDMCLTTVLNKDDIVFPRKDYGLYQMLFEENMKDFVKCKINPWEDGLEILEFLKKMKSNL